MSELASLTHCALVVALDSASGTGKDSALETATDMVLVLELSPLGTASDPSWVPVSAALLAVTIDLQTPQMSRQHHPP